MNNSDMPISPVFDKYGDIKKPVDGYGTLSEGLGLTKREHFAGLAMQGILANRQYEPPRAKRLSGMAVDAVAASDALLAELSK